MEDYLRYIFNLVTGERRGPAAGVRHRLRGRAGRGRSAERWPATAAWARCGAATWPGCRSSTTSTAAWCWPRPSCSSTSACEQPRRRGDVRSGWSRSASARSRCTTSPMPGLWEFRGRADVHTYSSVMCWAACDRLAQDRGALRARATASRTGASRADSDPRAHHRRGLERGARPFRRCASAATASTPRLLLLADLGFVERRRPALRRHGRGDRPRPASAATACSATSRRTTSARRKPASPSARSGTSTRWRRSAARTRRATLFERMLARRNPLGLLSEDLAFDGRRGLGQLPADLFARRPDHRRDAPEPAVAGRGVTATR